MTRHHIVTDIGVTLGSRRGEMLLQYFFYQRIFFFCYRVEEMQMKETEVRMGERGIYIYIYIYVCVCIKVVC